MSLESYQSYNLTSVYMQRQLDRWGQPCTVFVPDSLREIGYEDLTPEQVKEQTGVLRAGTRFKRINTMCFINFKVTKSVYYHFNWFPEESEELCMAFFPENSVITVDTFVRTAQVETVSKYGDLIFKVADIKSDGLYRSLKKYYFLRPVSSSEVQNLLTLGESGLISI